MAKRSSITVADVEKAFDIIQRRGERVTAARVQAITGGSYTTLIPLMNIVRAKQAAADQAAGLNGQVAVEGLPPAVADVLASLGTAILDSFADARAEERRSGDAALAAARSEAAQAASAQAAELAVVRSDLDDMAAEVDRLKGELEVTASARVAAEEQARAATAQRDGLAGQTAELLAQLAAAKAETNTLRDNVVAANAALATARTQLQQARELMTKQQRLQFDNLCSPPHGLYSPTSAAHIAADTVAGSDNNGPIGVAGPK